MAAEQEGNNEEANNTDQGTNGQDNTNADNSVDQNAAAEAAKATEESKTVDPNEDGGTLLGNNGDDKGGEGEGDDKGKAEAAPEEYEDFTLPEGVVIAEETAQKFDAIAKELGLSQEAAQKVLDLGVEMNQKASEDNANQWKEAREAWVSEIKNDPEIGGKKFGESIERAKRALSKFGSDELNSILDQGMGDNPALIRLLVKVDKATSDDSMVDGKAEGVEEVSAAEAIYGKQK